MKNSKNKLVQAANLIEELSWLLESNKSLSLKEVSELLRDHSFNDSSIPSKVVSKYANSNPNKQFLVGALPALLQDNSLFKSNSEMLDFAEDVLNLSPSRAAKRSRIEYIGWIICEVSNLNDKNLESLVYSLSAIVGDENKIKKMKAAKKEPNFSWNTTIQNLGE